VKTDQISKLETKIREMEKEIRTLRDIEEIQRVQRSYGYYIEHWMAKDIIDLFSDGPEVSLTLAAGTYLGKKGVKRYFNHMKPDAEFLHQVMQLSPIIDVNPDGKTAEGRWWGYGAISFPRGDGASQSFMGGIYTSTYVKEKGIWKIQKLQFDQVYSGAPASGWVAPEKVIKIDPRTVVPAFEADIPRKFPSRYPSGRITPFHFKHPVTGKKSGEDTWNNALEKNVTVAKTAGKAEAGTKRKGTRR
jgi:hypothetical protein